MPKLKREDNIFSPSSFRANEDTFWGEIEGHISLAVRLAHGAKKYGKHAYREKDKAGVGRWSIESVIDHAIKHLENLRDGIPDDAGSDPRHHIGAVLVACHILAYYAEHMYYLYENM